MSGHDEDDGLLLAQLMCARLCHDLISPVGAINAGLEVFGEGNPELLVEAAELAGRSARQAARKLAFFRAAFGLGRNMAGRGCAAARTLAVNLFDDGKAALDWPDPAPAADQAVGRAEAQMILNLVLLGAEALPRGGTVSVRMALLDGALGVAIKATGESAGLRPEMLAALSGATAAEDLDARTVQAFYGVRLAQSLGAALEVGGGDGGALTIGCLFPAP